MAKAPDPHVSFDTAPYAWPHWTLDFNGPVATLSMNVQEDGGMRPGYELKLNSYDLGVDIQLYDAVQRVRFEHPEVRAVVVTSAQDRVFCAGANIRMLASSSHAFKVNFCKFTNETRCSLEEDGAPVFIAAVNGACAGGGYELALACEEIYLIDDGSSTVSLPEVPLLGVLPGTGGLTRLVDKRKVRRDLADVFCTKAEGFKTRDAMRGGFIDGAFSRSKWDASVAGVAAAAVERLGTRDVKGITLAPLQATETDTGLAWKHVSLDFDRGGRTATLTMKAPDSAPPTTHDALHALGSDSWALAAFLELERAIFELRFNNPQLGLILLKTTGDQDQVLAWDAAIAEIAASGSWLANEILTFQRRTLSRMDNNSRSMFALLEEGHAFAGVLFELALAADRSYMFLDEDEENFLKLGAANFGPFPMSSGQTRMATRFYGSPDTVTELEGQVGDAIDPEQAEELGLVTASPDDIDWDDEVRIAVEERASMSPDALTGMEQNLRFAGRETCDTRIFGRLTAWQNWIFQRPNAVGDTGALTLYGHPERPVFDFKRT